MKRTVFFLCLAVFVCSGLSMAEQNNIEFVNDPDNPTLIGYANNQIVVEFGYSTGILKPEKGRDGLSTTGINSIDILAQRYLITEITPQFPGAKPISYKGRLIDLSRYYIIRFNQKIAVKEILSDFRSDGNTIKAQPIGIHNFEAVPNDPEFINQKHLSQTNDHDIDAPEGWDSETGSSDVIIAIIDSGIRYFHKDLGGANASYANPENSRGNMWINWSEKNGITGIDDDSNGFIDDWIGWDFVDNDNDPRDQNGHGTHVAGIAAAGTNDGYGVAGVAGGWNSGTLPVEGNGIRIMALRTGDSQVNMAAAAQAFYYAANNGAKIASCSWPSDNSGGLGDAIDYFLASGGIIVKSAGNINSQLPDYINGLSDEAVISVAATDTLDKKADFSNYGTWVDISAPGTNIISTYHSEQSPVTDIWSAKSGTSMSAPMTAAAAALIWSHWPEWNGNQVISWLLNNCVDNIKPFLDLQYIIKMGSGRINISKVQCPNYDPEEWSSTFNFNTSDIANDIIEISSGEYMSLINSHGYDGQADINYDISLEKLDRYGCMVWSRSVLQDAAKELTGRRFIRSSDGGYLIVGERDTQSNSYDVLAIKTNSSGEVLWQKNYGGSSEQRGFDVLEIVGGDFLITGSGINQSGNKDILIMKIDGSDGDSLWTKTYGRYGISDDEEGKRILADYSGGFILLASSLNGANADAYYLWLNSNCDTIKTVTYSEPGHNIFMRDMELTSSGEYISSGYAALKYPGPYDKDIFLLKLTTAGDICWTNMYGADGYDEADASVIETTDGQFAIIGSTDAPGAQSTDLYLIKTNACGAIHLEEILNEDVDEIPREIIQTTDGGFLISGSHKATGESDGHSYFVKMPEQPSFVCGEVDGVEPINILDIVFIINYIYKGGAAPDPVNRADVNCDGNVDILDQVYLMDYKYKGGSAPCPCN